ncbi:MAG TPA: peptidylprolyl isomerase [Candidatus Polarisedimenticolaceae bacterium]|nr:peptidylprolyl isomerase [Candidatus Polarisedimenticolaceae bacterium]
MKVSSALAAAAATALTVSVLAGTPEKLMDPTKVTATAPEVFKAKFDTTKGVFVIEVHRDWSPTGADRFYALVKNGYYDGVKFFRVVPGFVVQWGIHGDPAIASTWLRAKIKDEPVKESNRKGFVTYAKGGPNTRSVQVFINLQDNSGLDAQFFSPFGKVVQGLDVVEKLNGEYGDNLRNLQGRIAEEGNAFLEKNYPNLDAIKTATIE